MKLFFVLRYFALTLIFLSFSLLSAQSSPGWALDPHAGLSSALLQPAATVATPYDWDANLVSTGVSFGTNYAFVRKASLLSLFRDSRGGMAADAADPDLSFRAGDALYAYDFSSTDQSVFGRAAVDVLGPALSVQVGRTTRIGVFSRLRASAGLMGVDPTLHYYPYDALPNGVDYAVRGELATAGASWGEVGLNLAQAFAVGYDAELRLGVSPRYLVPLSGVAASNPEGLLLRQFSGDSLTVSNANATLSLTDDLLAGAPTVRAAGRGFAVDLGAQYAWGEADDYGFRYTVGVSLLDLGGLTFNRNAGTYGFANPGAVTFYEADYPLAGVDSLAFYLNQVSGQVNAAELRETEAAFSVRLPAALGVQFAYRPVVGAQLAVAYRGGLGLADNQLTSGQSLTLAAHYSRWWFGGGLTAGVRDWKHVNVGLQLRAGPFFAGTDQLFGTLSRASEFSTASFYAGIRVHDFARGQRGGGRRAGGKKRRGRGTKTGCYQF